MYGALGFLVIASFFVICLPFFETNKTIDPEIVIKQQPKFPERSITVAAVDMPPV